MRAEPGMKFLKQPAAKLEPVIVNRPSSGPGILDLRYFEVATEAPHRNIENLYFNL